MVPKLATSWLPVSPVAIELTRASAAPVSLAMPAPSLRRAGQPATPGAVRDGVGGERRAEDEGGPGVVDRAAEAAATIAQAACREVVVPLAALGAVGGEGVVGQLSRAPVALSMAPPRPLPPSIGPSPPVAESPSNVLPVTVSVPVL